MAFRLNVVSKLFSRKKEKKLTLFTYLTIIIFIYYLIYICVMFGKGLMYTFILFCNKKSRKEKSILEIATTIARIHHITQTIPAEWTSQLL